MSTYCPARQNCSSTTTPQSKASLTCWVLARATLPASGSDCARSFANRLTKDESIQKNIRQPWLSEDTYTSSNLTLQRNVNRTALSDADFKEYSRPERTDRNNYLSHIADEVEDGLHYNNMRSAFRTIETLAGQEHSQPVLSCIHKADDTPCRSNEEVMQRWSEHFTAALNHLPATTSTSLESESQRED